MRAKATSSCKLISHFRIFRAPSSDDLALEQVPVGRASLFIFNISIIIMIITLTVAHFPFETVNKLFQLRIASRLEAKTLQNYVLGTMRNKKD